MLIAYLIDRRQMIFMEKKLASLKIVC